VGRAGDAAALTDGDRGVELDREVFRAGGIGAIGANTADTAGEEQESEATESAAEHRHQGTFLVRKLLVF
jgi:hypothetical protein